MSLALEKEEDKKPNEEDLSQEIEMLSNLDYVSVLIGYTTFIYFFLCKGIIIIFLAINSNITE